LSDFVPDIIVSALESVRTTFQDLNAFVASTLTDKAIDFLQIQDIDAKLKPGFSRRQEVDWEQISQLPDA
jgi:hypothetical protein